MPIKIERNSEAFIRENAAEMTIEQLMDATGLKYKTIYSIAARIKVIPKDSGWLRGYRPPVERKIKRISGQYSNPQYA